MTTPRATRDRTKYDAGRKRSGPSGPTMPEAQRETTRIVLRLPPDVATQLRTRAAEEAMTLSAYVTSLVQSEGRR